MRTNRIGAKRIHLSTQLILVAIGLYNSVSGAEMDTKQSKNKNILAKQEIMGITNWIESVSSPPGDRRLLPKLRGQDTSVAVATH